MLCFIYFLFSVVPFGEYFYAFVFVYCYCRNLASPNLIKYYFYQNDSNLPLIIINSQNASNVLNASNSYKFIIHGASDDATLPWVKSMAAALHQVGNFNIIAPDWKEAANKTYPVAAMSTKKIGSHIGEFILSLNNSLDDFHLIGDNLGSHVCGAIAQKVGKVKISRVTGLNPSAKLFERFSPFNWRLNKDSGMFVDVIHTETEYRGMARSCGTIDFYVNEGKIQPDCLRTADPGKLFNLISFSYFNTPNSDLQSQNSALLLYNEYSKCHKI